MKRIWDKVEKSDSCWNWTAAKNKKGYGLLNTKISKSTLAHRVIWELINGEIPKGMLVCHHCDNPSCVNPGHLFLGTNDDNMLDRKLKGRNILFSGSLNSKAKLTEEDVASIRVKRSQGIKNIDLAKEYGVSSQLITRITQRTTWRHV
jgi:hypothetical protein